MWRTGADSPRPGAMTGHSVPSEPSSSAPSMSSMSSAPEQAPEHVTLRAMRDTLARIADDGRAGAEAGVPF